MKEITTKEVEQAIKAYKEAKAAEAEVKGRIAAAEEVIQAYGVGHIGEFVDGRLAMESGIIALKAGTAKPIKDGKPLSTAARSELASVLPVAYVKTTCDFGVLYGSTDKTVRQLLASRNIQIVREDKFSVVL